MATALGIIDRLEAAILATDSGLSLASGRRPLVDEPIAGSHRRFEVRLVGGRIGRDSFGGGTIILAPTVAVQVSYARGGGDAGDGDRKAINIQAGEDAVLISQSLTDERNWHRLTTDIWEIRAQVAAQRVIDDRQREIYESRFRVEAQFPWPV